MTTETLYKPKGAGHSAPEEGRGYIKPRQELMEAFEKWMEEAPDHGIGKFSYSAIEHHYGRARELFPNLDDVSSEEMTAVLAPFEGDPRLFNAGIFLSAAYNTCPMTEIVYAPPVDDAICWVGYVLPEGKTILLRGNVWDDIGVNSGGTIVNYGTIKRHAGDQLGAFVNMGTFESFKDTYRPGGGFGIDLTNLEDLTINTSVYIGHIKDPHKRNLKIVPLIDMLCEKLDPSKTDEEIFEGIRGMDMKAEIRNILEVAGMWK